MTPARADIQLNEYIRLHRMRLGMTIKQAAARAGISRNYWSMIERGKCPNLTLSTLIRVCEAVGYAIRVELVDRELNDNISPKRTI